MDRAQPDPRSLVETVHAWLVTGPLGHLAAGIADWAGLMGHLARARVRERRARHSS